MKKRRILLVLASAMLVYPAVHADSPSPYAGQQTRDIKALSESEVADLLAGKGMGFAKAAELNGYPGPAHVLELATHLQLSAEQLAQTRAIHQRMEADARAAGRKLVEAEREVDALFRTRSATPELLAPALEKSSRLQAKVREVHLRAHIEQAALLSDAQIAQYIQLRGYTAGMPGAHGGRHHGHR